jgi:hypothetical protein
MDKYAPPSDDKGWEEIIVKLYAYAEDQINQYSWYRKKHALPAGYQAKDFVQEAVLTYIEQPVLYNPSKGKFLSFLKFYILRRLVYNLTTRAENRENRDIFRLDSVDGDGVQQYENYLPLELLTVEDEIDFEKINDMVIEQIDGDKDLEKIFEGVYINNLKRSDVCTEYGLTTQQYDNGIKRLGTIFKTVKLLVKQP